MRKPNRKIICLYTPSGPSFAFLSLRLHYEPAFIFSYRCRMRDSSSFGLHYFHMYFGGVLYDMRIHAIRCTSAYSWVTR